MALLTLRYARGLADQPGLGLRLPRERYVYELAGDVRRPGFYCFAAAQNLGQLRSACGGAPADVQPPGPDAWQEVASGSRVVFGARAAIGPMSGRDRLNFFLPLDVNAASAAELELVPGIGRQTAASIIAYRTAHQGVRTLAELAALRGMSARRLQALTPYLTIAP